jgi:hypothetical protein
MTYSARVYIKIMVFWNVKCGLEDINVLDEPLAPIILPEEFCTQKEEAAGSSEMFVPVYLTTRHQVSEGHNWESNQSQHFFSSTLC